MDDKDRHIRELQDLLRKEREAHNRTKMRMDGFWQALADARDLVEEALTNPKS